MSRRCPIFLALLVGLLGLAQVAVCSFYLAGSFGIFFYGDNYMYFHSGWFICVLYIFTFVVQTLIFVVFSRVLVRVEKFDSGVSNKKTYYRIYFVLLNYNQLSNLLFLVYRLIPNYLVFLAVSMFFRAILSQSF